MPGKRRQITLVCEDCNLRPVVQAYDNMPEDWPKHKCPADRKVKAFSGWREYAKDPITGQVL